MSAVVPIVIAAITGAAAVDSSRRAKKAQAQASQAADRATASRQRQEAAVAQETRRERVIAGAAEERTSATNESQNKRIRESARRLGQTTQSKSRLRSRFQKSTGRLGTLDK